MDEETKYWVAFSVFPGVGPVRFKLLLDYFGSAKAAWRAPTSTLKQIKLGEKLTGEFATFRNKFDIEDYAKQLNTLRVSVLTLKSPKYPSLLKQISDAPFVLYIKGRKPDRPIDLARTIGVVGTRKITKYGAEVTRRLVTGLVSYGFTIVSGLAYGVDAAAHQAAIDAGGKTIAVLGCGIDIIAPPSNTRLYHQIAEDGCGAIVSEMPLGLRPNVGLFPARNRIISGLSLGVVVTEGADDSGALITARNAGEQGREVFAVPGPITSLYSRGPAKLLKNGAKLVENVEDIIEELGLGDLRPTAFCGSGKGGKGDTKEEQKIIECLVDRHLYIDELVRLTGLAASVVTGTITVLEMKGIVKDFGEKEYGLV
ncbi:DNA protecting protein DprA [Candidatus Gottesmanbacteria bacterium RBG_13_45_10]|uniref:DNA protecting protein DprA n=1 Tax=Candidatus Gottesmanbacteria bacterium RBG_13_45_10 TaxID=1798370 RepID=A0A1F5ZI51_9BACT|nr:MAG: DNA protecting protein DprA [Candidatus Gottesmanbacteria bacterium RBG_13_45_10]